MAHSNQAKKRIRQAEARRLHNRAVRADMRTSIKGLRAAIASKQAEGIEKLVGVCESKLDRAAKRNMIPTGRANRIKGRLKKLVAGTAS
ncbi:MAG: 30S ribosomal protein S20 [Planctomycetota bacterium]|jgi:small subunit ribosomal protein S20